MSRSWFIARGWEESFSGGGSVRARRCEGRRGDLERLARRIQRSSALGSVGF